MNKREAEWPLLLFLVGDTSLGTHGGEQFVVILKVVRDLKDISE
jgi:hypothetical protein